MPPNQLVSSQHYTLRLGMRGAVPQVGQVLTWVRGIEGFMNHYGYVEADMQFLTWIEGKGDRLDGIATLRARAREQEGNGSVETVS